VLFLFMEEISVQPRYLAFFVLAAAVSSRRYFIGGRV
jgi:hypothetical protein